MTSENKLGKLIRFLVKVKKLNPHIAYVVYLWITDYVNNCYMKEIFEIDLQRHLFIIYIT